MPSRPARRRVVRCASPNQGDVKMSKKLLRNGAAAIMAGFMATTSVSPATADDWQSCATRVAGGTALGGLCVGAIPVAAPVCLTASALLFLEPVTAAACIAAAATAAASCPVGVWVIVDIIDEC